MTRDARLGVRTPGWGLLPTIVVALVTLVGVGPADAQPKKKKAPVVKPEPKAPAPPEDSSGGDKAGDTVKAPTLTGGGPAPAGAKKEKTFDFNALDLNGRMRTPQLLYFLERANEELERASLEKRSFIPHMVRSIEEEAL